MIGDWPEQVYLQQWSTSPLHPETAPAGNPGINTNIKLIARSHSFPPLHATEPPKPFTSLTGWLQPSDVIKYNAGPSVLHCMERWPMPTLILRWRTVEESTGWPGSKEYTIKHLTQAVQVDPYTWVNLTAVQSRALNGYYGFLLFALPFNDVLLNKFNDLKTCCCFY